MSGGASLEQSHIWAANDGTSLEHAELWRTPANEGWHLRGTLVFLPPEGPANLSYQIDTDVNWRTRAVRIDQRGGGQEPARLQIRIDEQRRWWIEDDLTLSLREVAEFRGLDDVDLSVTPATNTLPIRRLNFAIGESTGVVAAWIRAPSMALERLPQRYSRTGDFSYRYESTTFAADLTLDVHGVVTTYGDLWHRLDQ